MKHFNVKSISLLNNGELIIVTILCLFHKSAPAKEIICKRHTTMGHLHGFDTWPNLLLESRPNPVNLPSLQRNVFTSWCCKRTAPILMFFVFEYPLRQGSWWSSAILSWLYCQRGWGYTETGIPFWDSSTGGNVHFHLALFGEMAVEKHLHTVTDSVTY